MELIQYVGASVYRVILDCPRDRIFSVDDIMKKLVVEMHPKLKRILGESRMMVIQGKQVANASDIKQAIKYVIAPLRVAIKNKNKLYSFSEE